MNVVIRTDASCHIGSGHVMRCLVLAQKLKEQGYAVSFASRPQQGDLVEFVRNKGFDVYELIIPHYWQTPVNSSDYAAWLQVTWKEDAKSLIEQVDNVNLLIVDHYGLNDDWELLVKKELKCKVFAIDDLVRKHQADLILDQTLLRDAKEYQTINPSSVVLTGCDFALLNPSFSVYRREILKQNKVLLRPIKILVTMGGVDKPNATLKVLSALSAVKCNSKIKVTVLLGPKAPNYTQIQDFSLKNLDWIEHHDFVENMAELMSECCISIGAPGSTSWERACLGIPSIIIPLAENQTDIANNLAAVKAVIKVELTDFNNSFINAYEDILRNWQGYHETNMALCDGLGTDRVFQQIQRLF